MKNPKQVNKEKICEKNCPDYKGMQILHKEQCNCSCHQNYECDLAPSEHNKECSGDCTHPNTK